jgi:hypothetical protein
MLSSRPSSPSIATFDYRQSRKKFLQSLSLCSKSFVSEFVFEGVDVNGADLHNL